MEKVRLKLNDLREFEHNSIIEADLCIVGSGPAGLSIAKEFIGTEVNVWVVESGGLKEEADTQSLYDIESVGFPRVMQQDLVRNRMFGGSSHTWMGRCTPFDPIDFQQRDWVPYSGWSIDLKQLDGYLDRAREILGLESNCYDERLWKLFKVSPPRKALDLKLLKPQFWQFSKVSRNNKEPMRFGSNFPADAPNINFLLHANVTHLNTNQQGTRLESVEVSTLEKKRALIKAKAVVLCCGGIENARLLLASNRIIPEGVGNQNDTVGRFLMDHAGSMIGSYDPKVALKVQGRFDAYWLQDGEKKSFYLHGVALSPEVQAKEQLLNAAAFLLPTAAQDDPWTALKRLKPVIKQKKLTKSVIQDALTVLSHPLEMLHGIYRVLVKHRPPIEKNESVIIYSLVEQMPDRESRVTLSDQRDSLGMPLSKLNWKVSDLERQTVQRLAHLICQEFQRLGLPQPTLAEWINHPENWQSAFMDRAHPIGTTRMSKNPKEGVVDFNGQVHGVEGLFIAGSSVFPTAGHANPTLMIVALSIRLADWLKANSLKSDAIDLSLTRSR